MCEIYFILQTVFRSTALVVWTLIGGTVPSLRWKLMCNNKKVKYKSIGFDMIFEIITT